MESGNLPRPGLECEGWGGVGWSGQDEGPGIGLLGEGVGEELPSLGAAGRAHPAWVAGSPDSRTSVSGEGVHNQAESQNHRPPPDRKKPLASVLRSSDSQRALGNVLPGPPAQHHISRGRAPASPFLPSPPGISLCEKPISEGWVEDGHPEKKSVPSSGLHLQMDPCSPVSCGAPGERAEAPLDEVPCA